MLKHLFINFRFHSITRLILKLIDLCLGRVGCPHYMAPEVVSRRQYGKACDVWGAGIMLHVLLSGRLPFLGSGRRLQESIARARVSVSNFCYERIFFRNCTHEKIISWIHRSGNKFHLQQRT